MFRWLNLIPVFMASAIALAGLLGHRRESFSLTLLGDPYLHQIISFSLQQALVSTLLSLLFAYPVARALIYSHKLPGTGSFMTLCALAFVMPAFILITGIMILLGPQGLLAPLLAEDFKLFGWTGILIAHVYLNAPLAIRVLYRAMQAIPQQSWRLSQQMRLTGMSRFKLIEWPALKPQLGLLSAFIFVLCFNSFAVVLALGGGPQATTIEVAVYQALKFDYNLSEALLLSCIQTLIAGSVLLTAGYLGKPDLFRVHISKQPVPIAQSSFTLVMNQAIYVVAWLVLLAPVAAVVIRAIDLQSLNQHAMLLSAAWQSIQIATMATVLACLLGWFLILPLRTAYLNQHPRRALFAEWMALHQMVVPAMVLGVGWFAFFISRVNLKELSLVFLVGLNALILAPFVVMQLKPALVRWDRQHARLKQNWRLGKLQLLIIEGRFIWPLIKPTAALVFILALGDMPIFALFGNPEQPTLTWLIYRLAGTYRMEQAALASVLLLAISALIIVKLESSHARD